MTLRSPISNNTLSLLLKDFEGDFWIGLHLPNGHCPSITEELRGYKWIAGDSASDFQNWGVYNESCSSDCVSVSNNGNKWLPETCSKQKVGFLCEFTFPKTCMPLQGGGAVHYRTPQGFEGDHLLSLPPGSIAIQQPLESKYICFDGEWIMAPWQCEIDKGGCGYGCSVFEKKSLCFCPSGEDVKSNNITCEKVKNDPCLVIGCDHVCLKKIGHHACACRSGFELAPDGKTCNDINYCVDERQCPQEHSKCIQEVGGFKCVCKDGFKMVGDKCIDIDECATYPCEHTCKNTPGGYKCSCHEGYIENPEDSDLCKFVCGREECPAECDPNIPEQCSCPGGYIVDDRGQDQICVDLDECDIIMALEADASPHAFVYVDEAAPTSPK
ncbi:thrombomodulin [Aplochiton taeniatus]